MAKEIEKVKKEYEEKQRRKKEREKASSKDLLGHFLFFETFCLALRVDDWRAEMLVLQMCGAHVTG
jgi:hypothetical protein